MKTKIKWYSVKDKLPDINDIVLARRSKIGFQISNYSVVNYDRWGFNLTNVTHWAHLPEDSQFGEMQEEDGDDDEQY